MQAGKKKIPTWDLGELGADAAQVGRAGALTTVSQLAIPTFERMKRYGRPWSIVTDRLRSYPAAMKVIGNIDRQECGRWLNNRAENSHQPFRRREGAMARFRDIKALQKFASAHASIHNHFKAPRRDKWNREGSSIIPTRNGGKPRLSRGQDGRKHGQPSIRQVVGTWI
jgi:hypothetical protein